MIIWIVALVIVGAAAATGWNRGAVRAGISLAGLLVAAMLAMPIGGLLKPVLGFLGMKHPLTLVFAGPIFAFVIVLIAFKIGAHQVYTKIDYWLKYRATELQRAMFERMNCRVGLCVGFVNGVIYFIVIMVPFYVASYLTLQLPLGDSTPFSMKVVNTLGSGLRAAKMGNAIAGFDPAPASFYESADIVGLVLNNVLVYNNRLRRYPTLLNFFDRDEFRKIDANLDIQRMLVEQGTKLTDLLATPDIQAVVTNREIALDLQKLLSTSELKDLKGFLLTGISDKYSSERILGLWVLSIEGSAAELKKKNPQITSRDLMRFKSQLYTVYPIAQLVITTDNKAVLKVADATANPPIPQPSLRGEWSRNDSGYVLKMTTGGPGSEWKATVIGEDMYVTAGIGDAEYTLVFKRLL
jgi:hypothetical protein